ncbi:hypothetical protein ScPMuIL_018925 [Solemya velum]
MCEDSTATDWSIYLDASSAEHVSATQCMCTLINHVDGQVRFIVPAYTGCGTSIEVVSTWNTIRFGCKRPRSSYLMLNSGMTTNITLNKPATLSQSNAEDYWVFIYIDPLPDSPNMTVRCWSPGQDDNVASTAVTPKDKSATKTGIPDKTPTPTLGHTSSGQDCKQTKAEEQSLVEIVVPVVVVAVVLCVATIVGSVIYVRRHTDSKRNPTYDKHANTAAHDMHVYKDTRQTSDDL